MRSKLKPNEKLILITKLHWYPSLFNPLFLSAFCFAVGLSVGSYFYLISIASIVYAAYAILDRQCNIWIVTNLRVIDESGLFTHHVIESPLDKINNISFSQGIWGRQLGYGNVMIQTAAGHGATTYVGVENPQQLKDTITTAQEEYKKSSTKVSSIDKTSIATELEKIYDLKQKGILTDEEYNNLKTKILNS